MKCAGCGKQNPMGARYCIRCGVEQALPAPVAAVSAGAGRARIRAVVPRSSTQPASDTVVRIDSSVRPGPWPATPRAAGKGALPEAHDPNARAAVASRTLVVAALAIAVIALAIALFAGWRFFRASDAMEHADGNASVMTTFPPEATPRPRPPAANATRTPGPVARDSATPRTADAAAAQRASANSPGNAPRNDARSADSVAPSAEAPVEIKPLPPRPAPAKATRRAAPAQKPPEPVTVPQEAEPAPAPAPVVAAAAPPPEPVIDRWARMSDELSRCTREDFIARVICDQRVRLRYCNGSWGKVAQCPANPNVSEHGQ